jgi:HEAT repeat protein
MSNCNSCKRARDNTGDNLSVYTSNTEQESDMFKRTMQMLTEALKDPSHGVQYIAAQTLADNGQRAIPTLLEILRNPLIDPRWVAFAFSKMGPTAQAAIPGLAAALKDRRYIVRGVAVSILGNIADYDKNAIPALNLALKDKRIGIRKTAAKVLRKLADKNFPTES